MGSEGFSSPVCPSLRSQKGVSLVGAVVASTIIGVSAFTFQSSFVSSTKNLYRLQLKSSQQLVVANLKISALSTSAIANVKRHDSFVNKCTSGLERCTDATCTGQPADCTHNSCRPVSWYNGLGEKVSGTSSTRGVVYSARGVICPSGSSFGKECPFRAFSKVCFYCQNDAPRCIQAESAKFSFSVASHPSVRNYVSSLNDINVEIPKVSPKVLNAFLHESKTININGGTVTRYVNSDGDGGSRGGSDGSGRGSAGSGRGGDGSGRGGGDGACR